MFRKSARHVLPLVRSWVAYAALPAAGIITAPILAHALGPEGRGQLSGILQPMTLASAIAALGVPSAVTYFIGQGTAPVWVSKLAVRISALVTLLVSVGLLLYSDPVAAQLGVDRGLILLIWIAFLPSAFVSIRRAHLQGLRRYATLDLERSLGAALRVGVIVLLWLAGVQSVIIVAAAYMIAGLTASVVLRLPADRSNEDSLANPRILSGRTFLRYSLLSSFGTIAAAMSARLDQALMPAIVPAAALGYYSAAVSVAEIPTIATMVAVRNVLAEVSGGFTRRAIARSVLIGGTGQLLMILAISCAIPYVLPWVFGADFAPAIALVQVLLLGAFVSYGASVATAYLAGVGRPGLGSIVQAVAAFVTALLFWVNWEHMDAPRAAWISVWSQIVALLVAVTLIGWMFWRATNRSPAEHAFVEVG